MNPFRHSLKVLLVIVGASLAACATPAVVRPIGIRHGGTEYRVTCTKDSACKAEMAKLCTHGPFVTGFMEGGPLFYDFVCKLPQPLEAEESAKQHTIPVFISPECKDIFYGPDFVDLDPNGKEIKTGKRPKPDYVPWDPRRAIPMAYKDPRSSITLQVESDGRHVAATDEQGKLLWVRNPWEDAHSFCPYRTPRPVVDSLKIMELSDSGRSYLKSRGANLEHTFVSLSFDSSQFGELDETTGDFLPKGQN